MRHHACTHILDMHYIILVMDDIVMLLSQ